MITKLIRTPGIYLVGFMACGKTTIGKLLADSLGWIFADLDEDIERQEAKTISEIFAAKGEEEFRRIEARALKTRVHAIECGTPTVLALGGGAFVQRDNLEMIESSGVSIWLDCPLEVVRKRVLENSHRPLARDPLKFEELYRARLEAYGRAGFRIPIEGDGPDVAVEAILKLPIF